MNPYLLDLIKRINNNIKERSQRTEDDAFRETRALTDINDIPELKGFIVSGCSQEDKIAAYIILSGIITNTNRQEDVQFLIDRIDKEDNVVKHVIIEHLPGIKKTLENNIAPLLMLLETDNELEKIAAIGTLFYAPHPQAEKALTGLDIESEKNVLGIAVAVLADIGTTNALPFLQNIISTQKGELKRMAKYAHDRILKKTSTDSYCRNLNENLKNKF